MKGERLGAFEELVLLTVHGLGDEAYGRAVQEVLERDVGHVEVVVSAAQLAGGDWCVNIATARVCSQREGAFGWT